MLASLVACGPFATGCGDDDESSSTAATSSAETTAADSTSEESASEDSGGSDSGGVDADAVYEACADAVSGSAAEEEALAACEQARSAFESCASQLQSLEPTAREDALEICSEAADQVISAARAGAGVDGY